MCLCVWFTDVRKVMTDAPEWVSLELAHHFLKLAIAAYAWPFVMYRYPFSGLTKLAANMTCCSCLRWVSPGTSMLMLGACCLLSLYRTVCALKSCTSPERLFFSKYFFAVLHMAPYCCWVNQDSIPSVVTRLWTGLYGVRLPVETRGVPLSNMCWPTLSATQSPTQWVPGTLSLGMKQTVCEVAIPLYLVLRLRMSEAVLLCTLYVHMAWTRTALPPSL